MLAELSKIFKSLDKRILALIIIALGITTINSLIGIGKDIGTWLYYLLN